MKTGTVNGVKVRDLGLEEEEEEEEEQAVSFLGNDGFSNKITPK